MKHCLLPIVFLAGFAYGAPEPMPPNGPGTVIDYDAGYIMRVNAADGTMKERWHSAPIVVVVVGLETRGKKPCFACVKQGDKAPYDEFFLIPVAGIQEATIRKSVPGVLPIVSTDLPVRCEPPKEKK